MHRSVVHALVGLALALSLGSCVAGAAETELVYIATRTDAADNGIYAARFDPRTGRLMPLGRVSDIERPTWLLAHPTLPVLYSVSELGNDGQGDAGVYSFAVDRPTGQLRLINRTSAGGGGATHLAIDARSRTLFVANFGAGSVTTLPIRADGSLGAVTSVARHGGSGPRPRQLGPHAHSVELAPDRRFLLSADLGADRIFIHRFDARSGRLTGDDPPPAVAAPGAGPRHTAFHPRGRVLLLITQFTAELQSWRWDARHGRLQLAQSISTVAPDFKGVPNAAEVIVDRSGRHAYVTNNSEDVLLVHAIDARSGALTPLQRIASQGKGPRALSFDPAGRWLLVMNTGSNTVNVFGVDRASGQLRATAERINVPAASNAVFMPR